MVIRSINPTTEEVLAEFAEFTPEQVDTALKEARQAFIQWRNTSIEARTTLMRYVATFLRQQKEPLSHLVSCWRSCPGTTLSFKSFVSLSRH
jgi:succinate-semialdehyde dehydrogenase / glutarate-semialdehyde dehydrogenase